MKPGSLLIAAAVLFTFHSFAQPYPQLRLKLGATKNFRSPPGMSTGFAYKSGVSNSPYPGFGLEYSKPLKNGRSFFLAGVSFDMLSYSTVLNEKNFSTIATGGIPQVITGVFKPYIAYESRFSKKELPPHKNYFTWFVGLGLTINPFSKKGTFAMANYDYRDPNAYGTYGITNDGRELKGSELYISNQTNFSAAAIAGLRWHIRNKRGSEIMLVELLVNYGLTRYYNYEHHYRLNGQPAFDRLGEKGFYVQLNVIIPLANFGKRKK